MDILVVESEAPPPENIRDLVVQGQMVLCLGLPGARAAKWLPFSLTAISTNACFTRIEELPVELLGLSNADWAWHGRMQYDAIRMQDDNI